MCQQQLLHVCRRHWQMAKRKKNGTNRDRMMLRHEMSWCLKGGKKNYKIFKCRSLHSPDRSLALIHIYINIRCQNELLLFTISRFFKLVNFCLWFHSPFLCFSSHFSRDNSLGKCFGIFFFHSRKRTYLFLLLSIQCEKCWPENRFSQCRKNGKRHRPKCFTIDMWSVHIFSCLSKHKRSRCKNLNGTPLNICEKSVDKIHTHKHSQSRIVTADDGNKTIACSQSTDKM